MGPNIKLLNYNYDPIYHISYISLYYTINTYTFMNIIKFLIEFGIWINDIYKGEY